MSSFTAPIGSDEERSSDVIWPGKWVDVTPYLTHYAYGFHTGADLNLNFPHWDQDAHSSVRAMGNGTVTYAQLYSRKVWGKLIVIDHGIVEGRPLFSRYAHVENICVTAGQSVQAGEMIANVGNGEGLFPYHLHFDISVTEQLRTLPNDWPNEDKQRLIQHYVDPKAWLQAHVLRDQIDQQVPPATPPSPLPMAKEWFVVARFGCRVRQDHSTAATQVGSILLGEKVTIEEQTVNQEDYTWGRIRGGMFNGDWMAMGTVDQTDMFVSSTPPS